MEAKRLFVVEALIPTRAQPLVAATKVPSCSNTAIYPPHDRALDHASYFGHAIDMA